MKKALIIPAVIVVLLVGCRPEENREQLKAVNRSLEYANEVMKDANNMVYEELMAGEHDVNLAFYVEKWKLKSMRIKLFADSVKEQIKNIKSELIKQSEGLRKEHVPLVKELCEINDLGNKLLNKLIVFKDSCPAVICAGEDIIIRSYYKKELEHYLKAAPLMPGYRDSLSAVQQHDYTMKWLNERFNGTSTLMAMIMLNKIENDVLTMEKRFIDYCNSRRSRVIDEAYTMYSAVATVSSSYVKAGQSIEVYAGLGSFTVISKPRITIDGKEVALSQDGVAEYQFIAAGKPGKYAIPVTIEFTKIDGSKEFITKKVKYIIAGN